MSMERRAGAFVVLVGPDGVGKTAVAHALVEQYDGPTAYFHFIPPVRGRMAARPPTTSTAPQKIPGEHGSRLLGWCRLARNVVRVWLGYLASVRPAVHVGSLVIGDRCVYGYLVRPQALGYYGPRGLASAALRLLPHPDLVANLYAPSEIIRCRKQELTESQIDAELGAWSSLPEPRLKTFAADEPPRAIACRILRELRR